MAEDPKLIAYLNQRAWSLENLKPEVARAVVGDNKLALRTQQALFRGPDGC